MSQDWQITKTETAPTNVLDAMMEVGTFGLCRGQNDYEVTNQQTGEVRHITAYNTTQVGDAIAHGRFRKD